MVCVYCKSPTQVKNSREHRSNHEVWRRRQCANCGFVTTSYELPDLEKAFVVQYNALDLRPFLRDQLFISVYEACRHRPQPLTDATHLTRTVIAELLRQTDSSVIPRDSIVVACQTILGRVDSTAATLYGALHP